MHTKKTRRLTVAAMLAVALVATAACGSDDEAGSSADDAGSGYPNKPITIVVPYGAGGGTDVVSTIFVDAVTKATGAEIRRVNMPGAGGSQGTRFALDAAPDGYTIGFSDPGPALALPLTQDVGYDPDDMTQLGRVTQYGFGIVVKSDGPYKTLEDLVAAAGNGSKQVTYASSGPLAVDAIGAELLAKEAGVTFRGVPFSGSGEATLAVLSGDVDFGVPSMSAALSAIADGRLTMLATTLPSDSEPVSGIEDVPTASKAGVDYSWESFRGLVAPAGVPDEVTAFWDDTFEKMEGDDELAKALADAGERWSPLGPSGMQDYFEELRGTVEPIVKSIQS